MRDQLATLQEEHDPPQTNRRGKRVVISFQSIYLGPILFRRKISDRRQVLKQSMERLYQGTSKKAGANDIELRQENNPFTR